MVVPNGVLQPPAPESPAPHNVPAILDSFVGRDEDLAVVSALLESARLITLIGHPGVGKTRLALQVATAAAATPAYPDGVWHVALAAVADAAQVPAAVAATLSVTEQPGRALSDTLATSLADQHALLVFDNCEHVVAEAARLVDTLLRTCPELKILATSQVRLGVAGEHPFAVAPLAVPPMEASTDTATDADALGAYSSVALFCQRAALVRPGFALDASTAPAVAEICRRLDGIPLAIELAAATAAALGPADIAAHLDERFELLTRGSPSPFERHQSLGACLLWSHSLLDAPHKTLLARLGVFAGGADLAAIKAVCAGGVVKGPRVAALVDSLAQRSLLVADTAGPTAKARYRLLESVRHFGLDRLAEAGLGEADEVARRHAHHYLDVAERAEPELTGADQVAALDGLDLDAGNLRAALAWAAAHDEVEFGLRLAGALTVYWRVRGSFSEGRHWLARFLQGPKAAGADVSTRAKAHWGLGFLALMTGNDRAARPELDRSIALYKGLGDARGQSRGLLILGNCVVLESREDGAAPDIDKGIALLEQAVKLAEGAGDAWCVSHSLALIGIARTHRAETKKATAVLERAVSVARGAGDDQGLRLSLWVLGDLLFRLGEFERAEEVLEECLGVLARLGDAYFSAMALQILGEVALWRGRLGVARARIDQGILLARRAGEPANLVHCLTARGSLALAEGDTAEARRWFERARSVVPGHLFALLGLAEVARAEGDIEASRTGFEVALEGARRLDKKAAVASALHGLGCLAAAEGAHRQAPSHLRASLAERVLVGDRPGAARSLDELACLASNAGAPERAVRLFAVADVLRNQTKAVSTGADRRRCALVLAAARATLGDAAFKAAWADGQGLSLRQAAAYATRGAGSRRRPAHGWDSLSPTETDVAALVAEGFTNPQIAQRLFIAPKTVGNHLYRIYAKLGISSRAELSGFVHHYG